MAKVLIVDDEETIRKLLTSAIQRQGHEVVCVEDGYRACDVYPVFQPKVIISDIKMPRMTGFQMWEQLKAKHKDLPPIIFITGHGEKSAAIESLRMGAFDYLEKPFDMNDFTHRLEAAVKSCTMQEENRKLSADLATANEKLSGRLEARTELVHRIQHDETKTEWKLEMLGTSPGVKPVRDTISQLLKSPLGNDVGVLITGPSGSGKEVAARLIHELSGRSKGPWVPVNCGALPESLIESELFGHEKGAFTGANGRKLGVFELADGGTLFLDEIGELPLNMQSKLLRALQEKSFRRVGGSEEVKVDVRVVAATNKDLRTAAANKSFREDLFYRLNTVQIQVPALRDRMDDLQFYCKALLGQVTKGVSKAPREFLSDCFPLLSNHDWPGNLRELKSVIQRAALLSQGPVVTAEAVANALGVAHATPLRRGAPLTLVGTGTNGNGTSASSVAVAVATAPAPSTTTAGMPYHSWKKSYMQSMEKEYLQQQLVHFHGNVSALARFMKVSRPNLCRLLKKHGLHAEEYRAANGVASAPQVKVA
ncbi:MAG TPA: sigma-54 dependent transcriptional regulator [Bdellovibrionota bacterium]|jgi:two-component system response regulator AtoC